MHKTMTATNRKRSLNGTPEEWKSGKFAPWVISEKEMRALGFKDEAICLSCGQRVPASGRHTCKGRVA